VVLIWDAKGVWTITKEIENVMKVSAITVQKKGAIGAGQVIDQLAQ
jgi:hypothetical protein